MDQESLFSQVTHLCSRFFKEMTMTTMNILMNIIPSKSKWKTVI